MFKFYSPLNDVETLRDKVHQFSIFGFDASFPYIHRFDVRFKLDYRSLWSPYSVVDGILDLQAFRIPIFRQHEEILCRQGKPRLMITEVERILQRKDPNLNFCPVREATIDLIIIILAQTE